MDKGSCPHGDHCHYAHGEHEVKVHYKYKTARCHNFWRTGECPLGSACNFYHSESERRKPGQGLMETSDAMEIIDKDRKSSKGVKVMEDGPVLDDKEASFERIDDKMTISKVSVGTNTGTGFPMYDEWTCDYGPKLSEVSKYLSEEEYLEYLRSQP